MSPLDLLTMMPNKPSKFLRPIMLRLVGEGSSLLTDSITPKSRIGIISLVMAMVDYFLFRLSTF